MDMDIMANIFPGFHTCVGTPKKFGPKPNVKFFKVYTYLWGTFNLGYGIKIPSWNAFMGVLKMYTSYELQSKSGRRWNWLTCTRTDKIQTPVVNLATLIRRCLKKKENLDFQEGQSSENRPLVFHWIYKSASWGEMQPYKGKRFSKESFPGKLFISLKFT